MRNYDEVDLSCIPPDDCYDVEELSKKIFDFVNETCRGVNQDIALAAISHAIIVIFVKQSRSLHQFTTYRDVLVKLWDMQIQLAKK